MLKEDQVLPRFRRDLKLYQGPTAEDGSPTYSLYDPVAAQYYQISWAESLLFQAIRPGMTVGRLIAEVEKRAPIKLSLEDLNGFFEDASHHHLLEAKHLSEQIAKEAASKEMGWINWFLMHYLYLRIPLLNPDAFLERTLPRVQWLISKPMLVLYAVLVLTGLVQLLSRFDEFIHTFSYFFNFYGVLLYALTITFVKIVHEFSHAYVAKYFKVRVPTMGVAFLVLWPVLYTDITDSWKLYKRQQRIAISSAGVVAESVLAGLATLGWALSDAGLLQSVFFVMASTSWISTLMINLNPAMRFDGYYLLSDLWGIDNLHFRSFTMARWQLRKWLLGFDVPSPDPLISKEKRYGMVIFSIYVWLYRLFLYTAIAIFVYLEFTKSLGIILFLAEIYIFMLDPFISEARQLYALRSQFTSNLRLKMTLGCIALFLFWFVVPLPHVETFTAITIPAQSQTLYVPYESYVEVIYVKRGEQVIPGQPLIQLGSKRLDAEIASARLEIERVQQEIVILSKKTSDHGYLPQKQAEGAGFKAKLEGLLELKNQLTLRSSMKGQVYEWNEFLHVGQPLTKDETIGKIGSKAIKAICFIPEGAIATIYQGQKIVFVLANPRVEIPGIMVQIDPMRSLYLLYPQLGSTSQGDLPVEEAQGQKLLLLESYYETTAQLDPEDTALRFGQPGKVEIRGPWRSKLGNLLLYSERIFWRESSF